MDTTDKSLNSNAIWLHSTVWKCESCCYSSSNKCKECGHEGFTCSKLGIKVEGDFYCKHWKAKFDVAVPRAPIMPTYPPYEPTWIGTTDDSTQITYTHQNETIYTNEDTK